MKTDHVKIKSALASFIEFYQEFLDGNDRATVIVGAAKLDDLLKGMLIKSLRPPLKKKGGDDLFGPSRPFSDFNTKINLSYRLGLVDENLCSSLHLVREIRNKFAHQIEGCDLDFPPHSDRARELKKAIDPITFDAMHSFFLKYKGCSREFRISVSLIAAILEIKTRNLPRTMNANPASMSWLPSIILH